MANKVRQIFPLVASGDKAGGDEGIYEVWDVQYDGK